MVPGLSNRRGEILPARLAQNIAPLFGVPWPAGPFGLRTWVSDFSRITLSELARGAPLPTRSQIRTLRQEPAGTWRMEDRTAISGRSTTLPCEIPNASLNRFGPDTRAAVVLAAANRLLEPVADGIGVALQMLRGADGEPLPLGSGLVAWAGLVLETFRGQPALVAASIRARAIQRELVDRWDLPIGSADVTLTRCEIGSAESAAATDRPRVLNVADLTLDRLGGPLDQALQASEPGSGSSDTAGLAAVDRDRRSELVGILLRSLLALGTPDDASHLWLSRRSAETVVVEALVSPTGLLDRFVRRACRHLGVEPVGTFPLPSVPTSAELSTLPLLGRRAMLIALLAVLRHTQYTPGGRESTRAEILPLLDLVADLAGTVLTADDPVAVVSRCRVADMRVQTLRANARNDLRGPLAELRAAVARVRALAASGALDRGAAAEAISSANVELNVVRWSNALHPDAGLPPVDELDGELRGNWRAYHDVLELPLDAAGGAKERAAGFHLHNYAAFLARSTDGADLEEALRLFTDVVLPAREAFFERTGSFRPLRHSLQVASRATTSLAEAAAHRGHLATARRFAATGLAWLRRALADAETGMLLAEPTERAVRLALLAAPALLVAAEVGAGDAGPGDVEFAGRLIGLVEEWERHTGAGVDHVRHSEVIALRERLAAAVQVRP